MFAETAIALRRVAKVIDRLVAMMDQISKTAVYGSIDGRLATAFRAAKFAHLIHTRS